VPRQPDRISVHTSTGEFDRFSRITITNDITSPTEAVLELGDDDAYNELRDLVAPGEDFTVRLNGKPRLKGRAEINVIPADPQNGIVIQLTIRTKLSDARYASGDPKTRVENSSVEEFLLALYKPLGFAKADFLFAPNNARDLITGLLKGSNTVPEDFEAIKVKAAKVKPPETIYNAAERHLKRYGATQWHGPDGRIIVGRPDDTQDPTYRLLSKRGKQSRGNNVVRYRKIVDFSEVPSSVVVYGQTRGGDITKSPIKGVAVDADAFTLAANTGHFNRLVVMSSQQAKTQAQADRIAQRELSKRIRRKDAYEVTVDGWSYWTGTEQIPWANNATADLDFDAVGGNQGKYLIVRVDLDYDIQGSATTRLSLVAPGIWVI